jgi:hypothetical protein
VVHENDGPEHRALKTRRASEALHTSVESMKDKLRLSRTTEQIVKDIKATMNVQLPLHNFTVLQTLCEHERAKTYNQSAADAFPDARKEVDRAINDLATLIEPDLPPRKRRKLAANFWKWDHAADRRARQGSRVPFKGRPEAYVPEVVRAFADAITCTADRSDFATGHHGDVALSDDDGGPMFKVLVAAVRWAMTTAWQVAASPGAACPIVKPEGILTVIKRGRATD